MLRRVASQTASRVGGTNRNIFLSARPSGINNGNLVFRRTFALPRRPEPVRVRLPDDDTQGIKPRSIPKWFRKEGDAVKSGEPLCEVDAGDVVYDFNSPVSGVLVRITAKEGSVDLKGGEVIAYLAGAPDEITSVAYEAAKEIAEHKVLEHGVPLTPEPVVVSSDEIAEWLKKVGGNDELLEYLPALKDEGYGTIEAIKTLEENDFDALKITKRGHRKLLLAAVNALNAKPA